METTLLQKKAIDDVQGTIDIYEGRPFISAVPFYEVFVDNLNAESMDDINELVHRRAFPVTYVYKRWGFSAEPESIVDTTLASYNKRSKFGKATVGDLEYCYVYEYYKKTLMQNILMADMLLCVMIKRYGIKNYHIKILLRWKKNSI